MKFKSKKDLWAIILLLGCPSLLSLGITYVLLLQKGNQHWLALISVVPALLLIWTWFDTSYEITNSVIKIMSGPIRTSVKIQDIKIIIIGGRLFSGLRPALSSKGCVIKYERWNEVYISPQNVDLFNEELIKINPDIILS